MELIRHEVAHLDAFEKLAKEEGITEEICLKFGETFDAAMTEEAWTRLKGAYEAMKRDQGEGDELVKSCRLIENAIEAEDFSQMKGALAAVVHPAGQMSVYPRLPRSTLLTSLQDGHTSLYTPCCALSSQQVSSTCKPTHRSSASLSETRKGW